MRLLLIEDEKKTALHLKRGLTESGFTVDVACNGVDGLFYATQEQYDLVILDIMLPQLDGWTILQKIRVDDQSLPLLILTARDSVNDRVKGLELGADDYLIKPFSFSELLARIHNLLRRGLVQKQPLIYQVDDLEVNLREHKATRAGEMLQLTAKEFSLLALLIRHQGELLTRSMIIDQIWDINFDTGTNIVDVMIRRLRQKIDVPFNKKLIHAMRGVGYVLELRD